MLSLSWDERSQGLSKSSWTWNHSRKRHELRGTAPNASSCLGGRGHWKWTLSHIDRVHSTEHIFLLYEKLYYQWGEKWQWHFASATNDNGEPDWTGETNLLEEGKETQLQSIAVPNTHASLFVKKGQNLDVFCLLLPLTHLSLSLSLSLTMYNLIICVSCLVFIFSTLVQNF